MTQEEVRALLRRLEDAQVIIGSAELGTPEYGIGDTFCTYAPDDGSEPPKMPFATIVTHDTPGWDEVSDLDRPEAFRVNIAVGRDAVPQPLPEVDFAAEDVVLPHPQYAAQGWISVVNPGSTTGPLLDDLIGIAHRRARACHRRQRPV